MRDAESVLEFEQVKEVRLFWSIRVFRVKREYRLGASVVQITCWRPLRTSSTT